MRLPYYGGGFPFVESLPAVTHAGRQIGVDSRDTPEQAAALGEL